MTALPLLCASRSVAAVSKVNSVLVRSSFAPALGLHKWKHTNGKAAQRFAVRRAMLEQGGVRIAGIDVSTIQLNQAELALQTKLLAIGILEDMNMYGTSPLIRWYHQDHD